MANRYWVGGTDNWDGTAGSKWSATSGGTGGASVPTSSDDVFFDANSGNYTITVTGAGTANFNNLNCTGFTGTLVNNSGSFSGNSYGNITLGSGMTFTGGFYIRGNCTLTTNGVSMDSHFECQQHL